MINKNEKGFALVLSLILLLVMSLMGGTLIVISSGDHQSNNTSDQYQQAFYVAETGLLEGEKNIINQFLGPWTKLNDITIPIKTDPDTGEDLVSTKDDEIAHTLYLDKITPSAIGEDVRHINNKSLPRNQVNVTETNCFKSFRNIKREDFQVAQHVVNQNFGKLIEPIFGTFSDVDSLATGNVKVTEKLKKEREYLKRFRYEYFSVYIGTAPYFGTGSSIKKKAIDSQTLGAAYKIYACGFMVAKGTDLDEYNNKEEIIIPLETIIVMPN